jgi:hypothetical protein
MLSLFALGVHFYNCAPRAGDVHMADPLPYPGAPRWVKASGVAVGVVALLVVILIHTGAGHNSQPLGDLGGHAATENGH